MSVMAIAALPVGMISFEVFRASRSSRRNRENRCGKCGGPLYAPGAVVGPSLLQGHLVCEPCAAKERRRLTRSLIAAGSITALTVLALAAVAIWAPSQLGSHPWLPVIVTALEYPAIFGGAVAWNEVGESPRGAASRPTDATIVGHAKRFNARADGRRNVDNSRRTRRRVTNAEADKRSIDCSLRSLLFDSLAAQLGR